MKLHLQHFSYTSALTVAACACNELGSEQTDECDSETGQCKCRERFTGRACDGCQVWTVN